MSKSRVIRTLCAMVFVAASAAALAADRPTSAKLEADKVCTKCHDENEKKPILSIYQTRHGVLADAAAPTCTSCHGASTEHAKAPVGEKNRKQTDIVFAGPGMASAQARSGACLAC